MRAGDRRRLDVIRQVETEVSRAKSAPGFKGQVDDALYREVISSYVKQMRKAIREYEQLGPRARQMADKLGFEVDYLTRWLPAKQGEEETRRLVREAVAELGASGPGAVGRVVGHLMKQRGDELDGAIVNRVTREELGE